MLLNRQLQSRIIRGCYLLLSRHQISFFGYIDGRCHCRAPRRFEEVAAKTCRNSKQVNHSTLWSHFEIVRTWIVVRCRILIKERWFTPRAKAKAFRYWSECESRSKFWSYVGELESIYRIVGLERWRACVKNQVQDGIPRDRRAGSREQDQNFEVALGNLKLSSVL